MKKNTLTLLTLIMFSMCNAKNDYYRSNQVIIIKQMMENSEYQIVYSVPLETMYYSSGCDAIYSKDSTEITLHFIRQRINTAFSGNLKSDLIRDKNGRIVYIIKFPDKIKKVTIVDPPLEIKTN